MRHLLLAAVGLLLVFTARAQNLPPTVSITGVQVDEGAGIVTVSYDLADPEGDACTVRFRASADQGSTYGLDVSQVAGDIGVDIQSGTARSIAWTISGTPDLANVVVQVIAEDGHSPDIQAMVDAVNAADLQARLLNVAIPRHHSAHTSGINAIRDTLIACFEAAGLDVTTQNVAFQGGNVPNVIGRQTGLEEETRTIIVDAHYDAVTNTPGADDNATGVVATMEAARILSQYRFRKSIRYIGFSFEEQGLVGSGTFVQSGIPAWESIDGVLNLEMIGYYSEEPNSQSFPTGFELLFPDAVDALEADQYRGNFLTVVGNTASQPLIDAYLQAGNDHVPALRLLPLAVPGNGQIAPDLRRSDHSRFWDAGIQALMLTDGSEFRNSNYHTPGDAPATIDISFLTNCTKATLAATALLAEPINAGEDRFALSQVVGLPEHLHTLPCKAEVFPNPSSDVVTLRLGGCAGNRVVARLFDLRGERITGRDLYPAAAQDLFEFPVTGLATGTYLLVLQVGEASTTLKVDIVR